MKNKLLVLITAVLLLFTACSNSSNTAVETKKENPQLSAAASEAKESNISAKAADSKTTSEVNKNDLYGTWERTGDLFEGLRVKVEKQGDKYKSSIIKLSNSNQVAYLVIGLEKWREITKKQDNLWTFKDYGQDNNKKEALYDMDMKLSDGGNKLELSDISNDGKEVGAKQIWKRID